MRLTQFVLATVFSAALVLPVMAQTTTAPATPAPATPAPAAAPTAAATAATTAPKPAAAAPAATTTATPAPKKAAASANGLKNGHYPKCTDGAVVSDDDKVNVNTATAEELDKLYGVGKARAKKIIDNRPYATPDELTTKAGLGKTEFANTKCHIKI